MLSDIPGIRAADARDPSKRFVRMDAVIDAIQAQMDAGYRKAATSVPAGPAAAPRIPLPSMPSAPIDRRPALRQIDENLARLQLTDVLSIDLVRVTAGSFLMGTRATEQHVSEDEAPQHEVQLAEFWIGVTPITWAQFDAYVEAGHPTIPVDTWHRPDHPYRFVTWHEAAAFCAWASDVSGRRVRLPHECEWEYAARGGDGRIYP